MESIRGAATGCGRMVKAVRFENSKALCTALVRELRAAFANTSARECAIMLSGGSTPMAAYADIAASPPTVGKGLRVFFSDDRHVPPDHDKSNFKQTKPMLDALRLPPDHVCRVLGERPLHEATDAYGAELGRWIDAGVEFPVGFLGLGADGHTASLFRPEHIEGGRGRWTIGVDRPDGLQGVSVTADFLLKVKRLIFVVGGEDKRIMAGKLLREPTSIAAGLATLTHPAVELWADAAAWPLDTPKG